MNNQCLLFGQRERGKDPESIGYGQSSLSFIFLLPEPDFTLLPSPLSSALSYLFTVNTELKQDSFSGEPILLDLPLNSIK